MEPAGFSPRKPGQGGWPGGSGFSTPGRREIGILAGHLRKATGLGSRSPDRTLLYK